MAPRGDRCALIAQRWLRRESEHLEDVVDRPVGGPTARADRDDAIIVGISRSGDIFIGNQKTALDQITSSIRDRIENRVDKTVFIKSDARAKYGDVVKVVDEVRSAGVDNVGLLTDRLESSRVPPPPAD